MNKFHIELYPKADLENEWAKNKHTPGAMPCMRCGGPRDNYDLFASTFD